MKTICVSKSTVEANLVNKLPSDYEERLEPNCGVDEVKLELTMRRFQIGSKFLTFVAFMSGVANCVIRPNGEEKQLPSWKKLYLSVRCGF